MVCLFALPLDRDSLFRSAQLRETGLRRPPQRQKLIASG
jgi:hypothetical protein